MHDWLSGLVVLAVGIPALAQAPNGEVKTLASAPVSAVKLCAQENEDDLTPEQLEAQKQFAAMKKEADDLEQNAMKALDAAAPEDRAKIRNDYLNKMSQARATYAVRALELAKTFDPKDPSAFEPLLFAMQNGVLGRKPAELAQAKELMLKYQVDHPQFGTAISLIASLGPDQISVIETIARDAKNPSTKGQAFYALGLMNLQYSSGIASVDAKAAEGRLKSAKDYFELVVKKYPEGETPRGKVGVLAIGLLNEMTLLQVGNTAPEVTCLNIDGDKQDKLSDYKGKVVVLDIWATVSRQSVAAIAQQRELVAKLKDKKFALISVCGDAKRETLDKFLEKTKMPWVHWFAGQTGIILDWGVRRYPTTYIIDHKGVIRAKDLRGKPLEKKVEELLAEIGQ